jgi:hypothetical protein
MTAIREKQEVTQLGEMDVCPKDLDNQSQRDVKESQVPYANQYKDHSPK